MMAVGCDVGEARLHAAVGGVVGEDRMIRLGREPILHRVVVLYLRLQRDCVAWAAGRVQCMLEGLYYYSCFVVR
jgi:hypothetical protein